VAQNVEESTSKAQRARRISKPDLRLMRLQAWRAGGHCSLEILRVLGALEVRHVILGG